MLPTPVLALCLLSVAAFAEGDNASSAASTSPDSGLPDPSFSNESDICVDDSNCRGLSYCDNVSGICLECIECCATKRRDCPRLKCHCHWFLTDEELKIVAQAVLGVAVFVTCVALLSLLWKICARRLRQRRAAAAGVGLLDDTVSLSSQQVFVVERLRDRPPRYEEAARDIAIEKPPPYTEVAVAQAERPPQTVLVGGVPVTLVVGGLTARDFMAPPPYTPTPARTAAAAPLAPPPPPATPPIRRLRRCVRKVVMISRLARRSVTAPEADCGSRPPKGASPRQSETLRSPPGLSGAAGLATIATAGSEAVVTDRPQSEAAAVLPVTRGPACEELGRVPDSPSSTVA